MTQQVVVINQKLPESGSSNGKDLLQTPATRLGPRIVKFTVEGRDVG